MTGASSGIGWASALALADRGCRVVLAARRIDELEDLAEIIKSRGGQALVVPTDVVDRDQVERLVARTVAEWGGVDVFVTNAGEYVRARVEDPHLIEESERSLAVNFLGPLYGVTAVLPGMIERGAGHLVVVGSIDGKKPLPLDAPYVVAKAALVGFASVARQELRDKGVEVTTVLPGRVDTPLIADLHVPWVSRKVKPERVARSIIRAVERNRAEVVVPAKDRLLVLLDTVAPRWADHVIRWFRLEGWYEGDRR